MTLRLWMPASVPPATILVRIVVGGVFLAAGTQTFLDPAALGAGRFAEIGIPMLLTLAFLLAAGAGTWSVDALVSERSTRGPARRRPE